MFLGGGGGGVYCLVALESFRNKYRRGGVDADHGGAEPETPTDKEVRERPIERGAL